MKLRTLALLAVLAIACNERQPAAEVNMADEPTFENMPVNALIRIVRTPCLGSCPSYQVILFADGTVQFHGVEFVRVREASAKLSPSTVNSLVAQFDAAGFNTFEKYYSYGHSACLDYATDQPGTITTVRIGEKLKTVYYNRGCRQTEKLKSLDQAERSVEHEAGVSEWVATPNSTQQLSRPGAGPALPRLTHRS